MPARPLYTEPKRRCGASDAVERGDVGQVAVKAVVVEAVAHDEYVGNRETDVVDPDVHLPPDDLVQEHARAHAAWSAVLERPLQGGERKARVDDVVDDEDVAIGDVDREVDGETHRPRGGRAPAVARSAHEVEGDVDREPTHQIGNERDRTLEDTDQHRNGPSVVARDRAAQLAYARRELALGDEHSARSRKAHLTATSQTPGATAHRRSARRPAARTRALRRSRRGRGSGRFRACPPGRRTPRSPRRRALPAGRRRAPWPCTRRPGW